MSSNELVIWFLILLAPLLGGLIFGFERVLKARMQNRLGPPLFQPFYDFFKLADKRVFVVHSYHASLGVMHFLATYFALSALLFGADLLIVIFLHLLASSLLVMGAYSVRSVFSHIGANRELIATLAHEPLFVLIAIGFYLFYGSFEVSKFLYSNEIPLFDMPLLFIAFLIAALIKLKKSPFDVAEAHQEIIGGAEIEYSGIFYEAIYTAKWLEYLFVYAFVFLFTGLHLWLGILLSLFVFILINLIDNSTARINYQDMIRFVYKYIVPLAFLNLVYLAISRS